MNVDDTLITMLGEHSVSVPYLPKMRHLTGSVTATILLQQMFYWYSKSKAAGGNGTFYKYKEPPKEKQLEEGEKDYRGYRKGDSWTEELNFSRDEFDAALRKMGKRIKASEKNDDHGSTLVVYWVNVNNKTYYKLNVPAINHAFECLNRGLEYLNRGDRETSTKQNEELSRSESGNTPQPNSSRLQQEITTEINQLTTSIDAFATTQLDSKDKGQNLQQIDRTINPSVEGSTALTEPVIPFVKREDGSVDSFGTVLCYWNKTTYGLLNPCDTLSRNETRLLTDYTRGDKSVRKFLRVFKSAVDHTAKETMRVKHNGGTMVKDDLNLGDVLFCLKCWKTNQRKAIENVKNSVYLCTREKAYDRVQERP